MRLAALSPILLLLSACGGDGTPAPSPTPTPTPTPGGPNTAPAFTSAATASIVENGTTAHQISATDAQNDPITLSISGGADAALFSLDATGRLCFRTAPNFDAPRDANGDNVYEATLTATDDRASSTQDIRITVTNSREGIAVRRVGTGFNQPVDVHAVPGSSDLYVIEKGGNIYRFTPATGARTLELTVADVSTDGERGLLGITVGPTNNGGGTSLFVVATSNASPDFAVQLRRYTRTGGSYGAPTILLSVPHPVNSNHNGGWVDFGPDGLLYMGVGDGGGSGDPASNAQNTNLMLGKILRLAATPTGYGPAPANPFAAGGGNPNIFALGLRNPFRASFDGNNLLIGDVGQNALEEVDLINTASAGANLGWPFKEGTQIFRGTPPAGLIDPVLQYPRGSGPLQGETVIGGRVYRGAIAGIRDHYVFADFIDGHIWSVPFINLVVGQTLNGQGFERRDADFAPDAGTIDSPVAFGVDGSSNLFIVDIDGEIFQVVAG